MTRTSFTKTALISVSALALILPLSAMAQDNPAEEIEQLRSEVDALQQREQLYLDRLEELESRLAAMERADGTPMRAISPVEAAGMRGTFIDSQPVSIPDDPSLAFFRRQDLRNFHNGSSRLAQPQVPEPATGGASDETADGERRSPAPTEAVVEISEQQQGRFGSNIGLDLGLSYSHFDNARISLDGFLALDAIFLGTISIDQVQSDIFTLDPTLRFGVSDRLFFDANLPLLARTSNFRSGGAGGSASALIEETVRDTGLGDFNAGVSYRLLEERAGRPDVVLNGRVKLPTGRHPFGIEFVEVANSEGNLQVPEALATGSGVYGASIGASVLKTLDPLVVFGNATYFHNFAREFDDIDENPGDLPGRVDIGDAWQFGAGLAFALNDKSSISMSYSQRLVEHTILQPEGQDVREVVGSQANVAVMNLGATFTLGSRLALVSNVGIGLTDDSPDMSVSLRIPYRF
ncbi:transporter [Alteraurantiacibacter aquimixticola]|uniref:Transporter n=1 Tax=Alteraurantiacibacter aquimixticola TaxID=2489173 RepID=A0A4V4U8V6_9SPHN|nr:transporter [Alteraurantiacibacter aquimixticola]TIX51547.1 hypothetical protein E5222_03585 [Alteraurantiacibacter aquimixticola]